MKAMILWFATTSFVAFGVNSADFVVTDQPVDIHEATTRVTIEIQGTSQGGAVTVGGRTGIGAEVTVATTAGESTTSIATRIAEQLVLAQNATLEGKVSFVVLPLLKRVENKLIFEGSPGEVYLTSTDLGITKVEKPANVSATVPEQQHKAVITWDAVAGSTAYIVYANGISIKKVITNNAEVEFPTKGSLATAPKISFTIVALKESLASPPSVKVEVNNNNVQATDGER
jgi:hypothetical protein